MFSNLCNRALILHLSNINLSDLILDERFFRSNINLFLEYLIGILKILLDYSGLLTHILQYVYYIISEIITNDIIPYEYRLIIKGLYHIKIKSLNKIY